METQGKYFAIRKRSTLDATPRQKSALCISSFKLVAIVTAAITIALYYFSGFQYDLFITAIFVILIPSFVSLFVPTIYTTGINWIKILDLTFHAICAILALVAGMIYLNKVTSEDVDDDQGDFEDIEEENVVNETARASGILAIVLSVLHVLIFIVICFKHNSSPPQF